MFSMAVQELLPVQFVEISSLWVRGYLGKISVFVTPDSHHNKHEDSSQWTKVYSRTHAESPNDLIELKLEPHQPIQIEPGKGVGLYIHSERPDDRALVYDNQRSDVTHEDSFIKVLPGLADLSNQPFSRRGIYGWGSWRERREFVGKMTYGVKYKLWQPSMHHLYPPKFRAMARSLLLVHRSDDPNNQFRVMPADCMKYILNMW
jgi:hypothetical protein